MDVFGVGVFLQVFAFVGFATVLGGSIGRVLLAGTMKTGVVCDD